MCERFFHSSVLERIESNLSNINWLYDVIWLHYNSAGALKVSFHCVTLFYQTSFGFPRLDLNFDCGLRDYEIHITSELPFSGHWRRWRTVAFIFFYYIMLTKTLQKFTVLFKWNNIILVFRVNWVLKLSLLILALKLSIIQVSS